MKPDKNVTKKEEFCRKHNIEKTLEMKGTEELQ